MNKLNIIEQEINEKSTHLKYLRFEIDKGVHIATLTDLTGYKIVKGYGNSIIEAINDMHRGLI